ncbi:AraC family transcriptional regulator [Mucilaginibacter conchicola]|uniref:AraC family transcriptional regulator n=1 Tax=Mucilaginibacter conchicola TaxID=2303333 RepID=A0A372NWX2_9SPHI|nr:AraC family transcriptional regulator [Mucilaginibacter conchicola]RFZ94037.1 AraC family transcriptional regulator [Mucilaginibacter conchicola]
MKRRDGFDGQKMINLPKDIYKKSFNTKTDFLQLYVAHIGFFPKALGHYREWPNGCEDNIIFYCLQGKGYYITEGKKHEMTANQFTIIRSTNTRLRYWADEENPWTIYWIHFKSENMAEINKLLQFDQHHSPVQIPYNKKGIDIWHNIYKTLEDGYSRENLFNAAFCLNYFLATFLFPDKHFEKTQAEHPDMVATTIKFMRANIEKRLTVEDMAKHNQLSASHFSTVFRKATGMPPIDYFNNLKMQKACQLLYTDHLKVRDVAFQLGYEDPFYFSRIFKKYMQVSPERYKLMHAM